ncbi:CLUMA_CG021044, isoform A [Clunio marinus]|uniref:CLUMA_CG021044, isoform A n=1 Tax=Clunio marinus TaxID=568069 RepID=A0A1J1J7Q0_9DIPT|nr:CLUMA_CG021044, isoform A [Clunio marinus]
MNFRSSKQKTFIKTNRAADIKLFDDLQFLNRTKLTAGTKITKKRLKYLRYDPMQITYHSDPTHLKIMFGEKRKSCGNHI